MYENAIIWENIHFLKYYFQFSRFMSPFFMINVQKDPGNNQLLSLALWNI